MDRLIIDGQGSDRCAVQARALARECCGTAPYATTVVLIEAPLPWPAAPEHHPDACRLVPVLAGQHNVRVQLAVPRFGDDTAVRVTLFRLASGTSRYERTEVRAPRPEIAEAVGEALEPDRQRTRWLAPGDDVTDILICSHGSRDRCCGSMGTRLSRALTADDGPGLVWRTSHLGGHRFAPTMLTFPAGRLWAWADGSVARSIRSNRFDEAILRGCFRGSIGLEDPPAQLLEREALVEWGPKITVDSYTSVADNDSPRRWSVELDVRTNRSGRRRLIGTVECTAAGPLPVCGGDLGASTTLEESFRLVDIRRG